MRKESPRPKDPYIGLSFWVEIDSLQIAGFSECSGISIETEVYEYSEGGLNVHTHKLPVRTKYANITLKRGIDAGQDLYKWYMSNLDGNPKKRKNITIQIFGQKPGGKAVKQWDLIDAWPVKWTGPDLKSEAGATAIETVEFAHNGINVRSG